jgi:hypothetical protein
MSLMSGRQILLPTGDANLINVAKMHEYKEVFILFWFYQQQTGQQ